MDNCQVFTPSYMVQMMLDAVEYNGENIKHKTIFEPSFGDGAFLVAIVQRMLEYSQINGLSNAEIVEILDNLYGVEIDKKCYDVAIGKLNSLIAPYQIDYGWSNLICGDALHFKPNMQFDLCVANPPYRKCKYLDKETRKYIDENYCFGGGNTDLYVVFFEHCINLMKADGKLCFITPNSYFKNSSQTKFREHIVKHNLVKSIRDFSAVKVFGDIATYTAVILLDFAKNDNTTEYVFMKSEAEVEYSAVVKLSEFDRSPWVFVNPTDAQFVEKVAAMPQKLCDICSVQHGIATNADKVYIVDVQKARQFEKDVLRPVVKASKQDASQYIIFPYFWDLKKQKYLPIDEDTMKEKFPNVYAYLLQHKDVLLSRDMEKNILWYQYARSQGVQNTNKKKIALKHIISPDDKTCEFLEVGDNTLVYSGIYITVDDEKNYDIVIKVLKSEEFHRYLYLVGKDMAGGYRNVSAKFVKQFGIEV